MLIRLEDIRKDYTVYRKLPGKLLKREKTRVEALRGISFSVEAGEILGYIGPNGAGKSTTIKIMSGILKPDGGTCIINGREPHKERKEHVKHIGVVFGQRSSLWWDVPVSDSFGLLRDIYDIPSEVYNRSLSRLTELLELGDILRTPARQLSLGQRMRCEVAAALLHEPDILFLDEPTIGLDAVSKLAIRSFIREINAQRGVTVLLTTHDMNDIEALARRVMLIGKGKLLMDGTLDDLRARQPGEKAMTLRFASNATPILLPGIRVESQTENTAVLRYDGKRHTPMEVLTLAEGQLRITDMSVSDPPIEETIASIYREMAL